MYKTSMTTNHDIKGGSLCWNLIGVGDHILLRKQGFILFLISFKSIKYNFSFFLKFLNDYEPCICCCAIENWMFHFFPHFCRKLSSIASYSFINLEVPTESSIVCFETCVCRMLFSLIISVCFQLYCCTSQFLLFQAANQYLKWNLLLAVVHGKTPAYFIAS